MSVVLKHHVCHQIKSRGFCDKKGCDCAHYLEEYSPPTCRWGNSCRFINMVDGTITNRDADRPCIFLHPCETHVEYYKRTNRYAPNIPNRLLPSRSISKGKTYYHDSIFRVPKCVDPDDIIHISVPKNDIPRLVELAYNQGWKHVTHDQSFKDF